MARPSKIDKIDPRVFDTLIQLPLIKADIAHALAISEDSLDNYCKKRFKLSFSVLQDQNRQMFRKNILGKQYELAMKGNTALLIWLGKQYLGQKDKTEVSGDDSAPIAIAYKPKSERG